jgi:hypothetical protein
MIFWEAVLGLGGHAGRKAMIDKKHDLPIPQQAKTLKLSRGSDGDRTFYTSTAKTVSEFIFR